jgi:hypothetical protein
LIPSFLKKFWLEDERIQTTFNFGEYYLDCQFKKNEIFCQHFSEKTLKCLKAFPEAGIILSVTTASWLLVASRKIFPGVNHGHGSFSFHPDNDAQQISSINFWINFS